MVGKERQNFKFDPVFQMVRIPSGKAAALWSYAVVISWSAISASRGKIGTRAS